MAGIAKLSALCVGAKNERGIISGAILEGAKRISVPCITTFENNRIVTGFRPWCFISRRIPWQTIDETPMMTRLDRSYSILPIAAIPETRFAPANHTIWETIFATTPLASDADHVILHRPPCSSVAANEP